MKSSNLPRDLLIAVFGGFVGAIFGQVANNQTSLEVALVLIIALSFFILMVAWVVKLISPLIKKARKYKKR